MGANLIDMTDCITTDLNQTTPDEENLRARGARNGEGRGSRRTEPNMPSHADRLSELRHLGVKVGTDGLTVNQHDKLSAILYRTAENMTQVLEARIPRHTIPLKDNKPAIGYLSGSAMTRRRSKSKHRYVMIP